MARLMTPKDIEKLRQDTGFGTYKELIDWARGYILIGVGAGEYQTAVSEAIRMAVNWASEATKLDK